MSELKLMPQRKAHIYFQLLVKKGDSYPLKNRLNYQNNKRK